MSLPQSQMNHNLQRFVEWEEIIVLTVRKDLYEISIMWLIICAGKYFPFNHLTNIRCNTFVYMYNW